MSYSLFSYIHFLVLSVYFRNLIRICWKCKTCVIFIIQLYTFLHIIRIFSESYSYILKMQNKCHIHYSVNYIYFWILSVYFRNLIRICWKCKTCVIFIIQYFLILLEYWLNFIRIFSESYSYMMNMQNKCDIHYSVIYIFEYYLYIFGILFVYIENAK